MGSRDSAIASGSWIPALTLAALSCTWIDTAVAQPAADSPATEDAEDPRSAARRHFERGITLVSEKDYHAAIEAFQRAHELQPHFAVFYNIAKAQIALGQFRAAAESLDRYLAEGAAHLSSRERIDVQEELILLQRRLIAAPQKQERPEPNARLRLRCEVPDVLFSLDDQPVAQSPFAGELFAAPGRYKATFFRAGFTTQERQLALKAGDNPTLACALSPLKDLRKEDSAQLALSSAVDGVRFSVDGMPWSGSGPVPVGRHTITASKPGYRAWRRELHVAPGETREVEVAMHPLASPISSIADDEPVSQSHTLAYALGGVGLALSGTALAAAIWNHERADDWKRTDRELGLKISTAQEQGTPLTPADAAAVGRNNALADSITRFERLSLAGGALGVGLIGAATFLYISEWQGTEIAVASRRLVLISHW